MQFYMVCFSCIYAVLYCMFFMHLCSFILYVFMHLCSFIWYVFHAFMQFYIVCFSCIYEIFILYVFHAFMQFYIVCFSCIYAVLYDRFFMHLCSFIWYVFHAFMQFYIVCFSCIYASSLADWCTCTSFNLLDCLHKCMKNIPHKTACTIWFSWWWT
jgi:hypothetical protein